MTKGPTTLRRDLVALCERRCGAADLRRIHAELDIRVPPGASTPEALCASLDAALRRRWRADPERAAYEFSLAVLPPPEGGSASPVSSTAHAAPGSDPLEARIRRYREVRDVVSRQSEAAVCGLHDPFKKIRRIGTPSVYGQVFLVEHRATGAQMAAKVMVKKEAHLREARFYESLEKLVLAHKTPHMPLVFASRVCDHCGDVDLSGSSAPGGQCMVLLSELANGDLRSWLETKKRRATEVCSFLGQLLMSLRVLETKRLVHNDLHHGNMLFIEQPSLKGRYLHYRLEGHDVFVRHSGFLWVMWDLGMTKRAEEGADTVRTDLYRILHFPKWAKSKGFPAVPIAPAAADAMIAVARSGAGSVWESLKAIAHVWEASPTAAARAAWTRAVVVDPDEAWRKSARVIGRPYEI